MSALTERQKDMLARGLSAFDASARSRRARRTAGRIGAAAAIAAAAAVTALIFRPSGAQALPGYVQIIPDDTQLLAELELARACERVSRLDGRLVVVECVVHPTGD